MLSTVFFLTNITCFVIIKGAIILFYGREGFEYLMKCVGNLRRELALTMVIVYNMPLIVETARYIIVWNSTGSYVI